MTVDHNSCTRVKVLIRPIGRPILTLFRPKSSSLGYHHCGDLCIPHSACRLGLLHENWAIYSFINTGWSCAMLYRVAVGFGQDKQLSSWTLSQFGARLYSLHWLESRRRRPDPVQALPPSVGETGAQWNTFTHNATLQPSCWNYSPLFVLLFSGRSSAIYWQITFSDSVDKF